MRGTFLKATSCADCDIVYRDKIGTPWYCAVIRLMITEYRNRKNFHPNCPMTEIHTVKEAVEAWQKGVGADGLICKHGFINCDGCKTNDISLESCLNLHCRPAKYKDGKLELMEGGK